MFKHEEYKPFKCEECDYSHASKHGLWLHFASHHRKESELPVCHLCGQKFKSNFNLRVHVESVHENKKNYSCDQCGAEFYFKRKFKWHMKGKFWKNHRYAILTFDIISCQGPKKQDIWQISDFQSKFSISRIILIFLIFFPSLGNNRFGAHWLIFFW